MEPEVLHSVGEPGQVRRLNRGEETQNPAGHRIQDVLPFQDVPPAVRPWASSAWDAWVGERQGHRAHCPALQVRLEDGEYIPVPERRSDHPACRDRRSDGRAEFLQVDLPDRMLASVPDPSTFQHLPPEQLPSAEAQGPCKPAVGPSGA